MKVRQLSRSRTDERFAITAALEGRPPSFAHCRAMFDRHGMVQFAEGAVKDLDSGYCLDDNARALIVAVAALRVNPTDAEADAIGRAALRFVARSQRPDGSFHNLMNRHGKFTDEVGSEDSIGRAIWACSLTARCAPDDSYRATARDILLKALPAADELTEIKPRAYVILGLSAAIGGDGAAPIAPWVATVPRMIHQEAEGRLVAMCAGLTDDLQQAQTPDWPWWEPELSWGNGRLPEALMRGALATHERRFADAGLRSLRFLTSITQPDGIFVPIGNRGWYRRGGPRPIYDQQPIEACCMVDAWLAAWALTRDERYREKAVEAFAWFAGDNTDDLMIAEPAIGGCHDGLAPGAVNPNMGAESTLSYLHAHLSIAQASLNG